MNAIARATRSLFDFAPPYGIAMLILIAGLIAPDCCLTGHHLHGAGMDAFGAICRARV